MEIVIFTNNEYNHTQNDIITLQQRSPMSFEKTKKLDDSHSLFHLNSYSFLCLLLFNYRGTGDCCTAVNVLFWLPSIISTLRIISILTVADYIDILR